MKTKLTQKLTINKENLINLNGSGVIVGDMSYVTICNCTKTCPKEGPESFSCKHCC